MTTSTVTAMRTIILCWRKNEMTFPEVGGWGGGVNDIALGEDKAGWFVLLLFGDAYPAGKKIASVYPWPLFYLYSFQYFQNILYIFNICYRCLKFVQLFFIYLHRFLYFHTSPYFSNIYLYTTIFYIWHLYISPRRALEMFRLRNGYFEIVYSIEAPSENTLPSKFLTRPRQRPNF